MKKRRKQFLRTFTTCVPFFLLAFLSGLAFYEYFPKPMEDSRIMIEDMPPITIQANDSLSVYSYQECLENYREMPEYLSKYCTGIILMDEKSLNEQFYSNKRTKNDDSIVAYAQTPSNEIYLSDTTVDTIAHELWHLYDYAHDRVSNSEECKKLYEEYKSDVTPYAKKNTTEFFAEAGVWYLKMPEEMQGKCPKLYTYFDNLPKEMESV